VPAISRRRFLSSAASGAAVLLGGGVLAPPAAAATDEELAFANFGATELLLKDFYAQVGEAKLFGGDTAQSVRSRRLCLHGACGRPRRPPHRRGPDGPAGRGLRVRVAARHVRSAKTGCHGGTDRGLGAYLTAAATSPTESFRVLYSSLAASCGEQRSVLLLARGRAPIGNPFPPALELEAASSAVEAFLG